MSFFGVADHFIVSSRGVSFSQAWFYAQTGKSIAEQRFFWHGRRSYEAARYWDKFSGFARSLQRLYYVQCMIGEIDSQSRRTAADECVRHIADTDAAAVLFIGKLNRELSPGIMTNKGAYFAAWTADNIECNIEGVETYGEIIKILQLIGE